jgi:L-ascorbate metabolism protein UlaG (beta-lactamase superfamily)
VVPPSLSERGGPGYGHPVGKDMGPEGEPFPDRVTWLGHSTVLLELSGMRLLTDPVLRSRIAHLVRIAEPVDLATLAPLDCVLISHFHRDHFDLPSLRRLPRDAHLVVPGGAGKLAAEQDFRMVTELTPGEAISIGSVTVTAVPALHDGRREPLGPALGAVGYVVSGRSGVYFAGDTDLFDGMSEIGARLDVALLPVWGWGPSVGHGHLDPHRAARALTLLRPRIAVPVHWGTLFPAGLSRLHPRTLREPPLVFAENAARLAPDVDVRVLAPGEGTIIDRAPLPSGPSA